MSWFVARIDVQGLRNLPIQKRAQAFDIVLCDLMMPELDGRAIYEFAKANHPELCKRIVFCTGGAFTPRMKEFLSSALNTVLEKPIEGEVLRSLVDRMCRAADSSIPDRVEAATANSSSE